MEFQVRGYKIRMIFAKGNHWIFRIVLVGRCQNIPKFDFQSQFSISKLIRIFPFSFFIEKFQFRSTFVVIDFFLVTFKNHSITKMMPNFWQLAMTPILKIQYLVLLLRLFACLIASFQEKSITKNVLQNWYSSTNKKVERWFGFSVWVKICGEELNQ